MNWYRVLTQHDNFKKGDIVLLPSGAREASLELVGYLRFVGVEDGEIAPEAPQVEPEFLTLEPGTKKEATTPKRGRRGKSVEVGSPESEPVGEVPGDELRSPDGATD